MKEAPPAMTPGRAPKPHRTHPPTRGSRPSEGTYMNEPTTAARRIATRTWVLRHPTLSALAKLVYCLLDSYADEQGICWPSNARLMSDLGISLRSLQRATHELLGAGVYGAEQRGRKHLIRVLLFASRGASGGTQKESSKKLAELASLAPATGKESIRRGASGGTPVDNSSAARSPELDQRASAADQPRVVDALPTGPIRELDTEGVAMVLAWSKANMPWSRNGHRRR